ncbi:Outer membrane efflux protein [Stratiformator vulcanicus]|uniref:Outer membrane efflux protein n=2 Tax=Stratiformator vulcanicus TaxID=2527980 RepID=A0A517QX63_9PLAN|nr:Outer membrane efflux protein [Stratiformator vulcanicus]
MEASGTGKKASELVASAVFTDGQESEVVDREVIPASFESPLSDDDLLELDHAIYLALERNLGIRIAGYLPQRTRPEITAAESVFDVRLAAGLALSTANEQVASAVESFGTGIDRIQTTNADAPNGLGDQLEATKLWEYGTRTRIGYSNGFQQSDPTGSLLILNPAWRSAVAVTAEQPLMRGRGSDINRIPILLARQTHAASIEESEAAVNETILTVHRQYWQAFLAQEEVAQLELLIEQASWTVDLERKRLQVGNGSASGLAQAESNWAQLRREQTEAFRRQAAASRQLRRLLELPDDAVEPLLIADRPSVQSAEIDVDWGLAESSLRRPDLNSQRYRVRSAHLRLKQARDGLEPDLSLFAGAGLNGLAEDIPGSLDAFSSGEFGSLSAGIRYQHWVGQRAANASVRQAEVDLHQETLRLQQLKRQVEDEVRQAADDVRYRRELVDRSRTAESAAKTHLDAITSLHRHGQCDVDRLVRARREWGVAVQARFSAEVDLANAVTDWFASTGTLVNQRPPSGGVPPRGIDSPPPAPALLEDSSLNESVLEESTQPELSRQPARTYDALPVE